VRLELGTEIREQPPLLGTSPSTLDIMMWSLRIRWWASSVAGPQDSPDPDVRIFVRYHEPNDQNLLENSVQRAYAWSVNGCASVLSAIIAAQIALSFGIPLIAIIAVFSYLVALGAVKKWQKADG